MSELQTQVKQRFSDWMKIMGSGIVVGSIFAITTFWAIAVEKGAKDYQLQNIISSTDDHELRLQKVEREMEVFKYQLTSLNANIENLAKEVNLLRIEIARTSK